MFPKISLYFAYLGTNCSKQSKLQTMKQRVKLEQEKAFKAHNPVPIKKKVHALIILQFLLFWDGKSQPKYIMIFHFRFTRSYRIRILKHNYRIHVIVSLRLRQIWFMFRCSLVKPLKRAFYQLRGSLPFWWAIACSFQLKSSFYKLKLSNWVFCFNFSVNMRLPPLRYGALFHVWSDIISPDVIFHTAFEKIHSFCQCNIIFFIVYTE